MNLKVKSISDEKQLLKIKNFNFHSLNRRLKTRREKIDLFCKSKFHL